MGDMPLYLGGVLKESVLHVFLSLHLIATSNKSELQVQFISNDKFFDVYAEEIRWPTYTHSTICMVVWF